MNHAGQQQEPGSTERSFGRGISGDASHKITAPIGGDARGCEELG
jgi:hypothetical protein